MWWLEWDFPWKEIFFTSNAEWLGDFDYLKEKELRNNKEFLDEEKVRHILENELSWKIELSSILALEKIENNTEWMYELYNNLNSTIKFSLNIINKQFPKISKSVVWRVVTGIFVSWIQKAWLTTVHEVAHADKAKHYWFNPSLWYWFRENEKLGINVFDLFISQVLNKWRAFVRYNDESNIKEATDISWAGINSNTQLSEIEVESSIYNNNWKVDFMDETSYLLNKTYLLNYIIRAKEEWGDPISVLNWINEQNWTNYELNDLKKYSLLSLFSWGVLSSLKGWYDFIVDWKYNNELIWFNTPLWKIYLPEFQTYLNSNNISVQISDYITLSNWNTIKIWFEKNVMWESWNELTIWWKYNITDKLFVIWELTVWNTWESIDWKVQYSLNEKLWLNIQLRHNNWVTNKGQRNHNWTNWIIAGMEYKF